MREFLVQWSRAVSGRDMDQLLRVLGEYTGGIGKRKQNEKPPFQAVFRVSHKRDYIIFTSMLTPEGRERFVRASITFAFGFTISMSRL